MKKCPYCAKEIKDEAIICRSCGWFFLNAEPIEGTSTMQIGSITNQKASKPYGLKRRAMKIRNRDIQAAVAVIVADIFIAVTLGYIVSLIS